MMSVPSLNAAWITWPCEHKAEPSFSSPRNKSTHLQEQNHPVWDTRAHCCCYCCHCCWGDEYTSINKILLVWLNVSGIVAIQLSAGPLVSCDICWRRRQQIPWGLNKTGIIISNECSANEIFIMEDAVGCYFFLSLLVFAHLWGVS